RDRVGGAALLIPQKNEPGVERERADHLVKDVGALIAVTPARGQKFQRFDVADRPIVGGGKHLGMDVILKPKDAGLRVRGSPRNIIGNDLKYDTRVEMLQLLLPPGVHPDGKEKGDCEKGCTEDETEKLFHWKDYIVKPSKPVN